MNKSNYYEVTKAELAATHCPYLPVVSIPLPESVLVQYSYLQLNVVFYVSG